MNDIAHTLINLLKDAPRPVVLHEPHFSGYERKYLQDCIETGWVSSVGSYVDRFENDLSQYTDTYAVPVVNGTAALHLALIAAGVQPGDEVLVPDLTFVATANAVQYCHAKPHFVEAEEQSYGVDSEKLDSYLNSLTNKPKFLIVTHVFGHPAHIDALQIVCDTHNIALIEDAAESLGSTINGRHTGTFGRLGILSFNGNKIMTTGGGGAVLTKDKKLAEHIKHLSTTAKSPNRYMHSHDAIGYNYRMPNINAALGCAQLEQLPVFLKQKQNLAEFYKKLLADIYVDAMPNTRSNYWLNNILMASEKERNDLLDALAQEEIFCRGLWAPMSSLPMYKDCPKMDTPVAQDLCARTLSLPSSASLWEHVKPS